MTATDDEISFREAGRRLGVSDTAVRKAKREGDAGTSAVRVLVTDDGKRVKWLATKAAWTTRSDVTKRSHVGSQGSPRRALDKPEVTLPTSDRMDEFDAADVGAPPDEDGHDDAPKSGRGAKYAKARGVKEHYQAALAKLDFEQRSGKLVDKAVERQQAASLGGLVIAGLYNIPDRISDELAGMTDANEIQALLTKEIDQAVEQLRKVCGAAA